MTTSELRDELYRGCKSLSDELPKIYEVDHETYANVIQSILDHKADVGEVYRLGNERGLYYEYKIRTGTKCNGIMFKNVELVLKGRIKL
jgi:hypothetical protein